MSSVDYVDINGGVLEGGGQIFRMALVSSVLLKKPVHIFNIRAGRNIPGLRPQHLAGLLFIRDISRGQLIGGEIGSTEIRFIPGELRGGEYEVDAKTAGSISLLIQVALPCLIFAEGPTKLVLKGATNADFAPQIDYLVHVFKTMIARFGVHFDVQIKKRGYYPRGGGLVVLQVAPINVLNCVALLDAGSIAEVKGIAWVAGSVPRKKANVLASSASRRLGQLMGSPISIDTVQESPETAVGNGLGIVLFARTSSGCIIGADKILKAGEDAMTVGSTVAESLQAQTAGGACVDNHLQDQVIIFMALAEGASVVRTGEITLHTKTAIYVAEIMLKVNFSITSDGASGNLITCTGCGYRRIEKA
uniref:RNA 3'-terminal phosphate cyclase n=1 Tax=Trichuris muris TaxID=70415 RepID=A0A5S6QYV5_TRIMR